MIRSILLSITTAAACLTLTQCGGPTAPGLTIVSGSENRDLEPLIQEFARSKGVSISMDYSGSVDISREIAKGSAGTFDAVWPAASIWIAVGDESNACKHAQSIMRSPVVFGLKQSVAEELGWTAAEKRGDISISEILAATQQKQLRFAMTSATQSNSGASWFLGSLAAFAETMEPLQSSDLAKPEVRRRTQEFLAEVDRSSGSSGWLQDFYLTNAEKFDGMVNYEVMVLQTNQALVEKGAEPLFLVYPKDGLTIADSPLAYINRGDEQREALFLELQQFLLSESSQQEITRLGRRAGRFDQATTANASPLFKAEYGVDLDRLLSPIPMPSGSVIREALNLYQTALRKPSITAFVVDYSGSMQGAGEQQLEVAMRTLLDQKLATEYLLQGNPEDQTLIVPFDIVPRTPLQANGNDAQTLLDLYQKLEKNAPNGGTDLYQGTAVAYEILRPLVKANTHHAAIIVMSDGRSEGSINDLRRMIGDQTEIPIFTILFGDADPAQMKNLASWGTGQMFDGREDVVTAFRSAKGYN